MSTITKKKGHEPLFHLTKRSSFPGWAAWIVRLLAIAVGFIVCGLVAYILIEDNKKKPQDLMEFFEKFFTSFYNGSFKLNPSASRRYNRIWEFFRDTAILQCIALAVTPAFRMRFWNIGAEGQTLRGALAAIGAAFYLGGTVPEWVLLLIMLAVALIVSSIWAVIPALFKAQWNTNETLFTLMMNYVAIYVVDFFLKIWVPTDSSLDALPHGALPVIENNYLFIILVAAALTVFTFIYLRYTKHGYEISVVGESVRTAQYSGIHVKKVIIRTMLVSGLICGLTGFLFAGKDNTITTTSIGGQGFTAIIVSWMGYFNPLMMLFSSALVTILNRGKISTDFGVKGAYEDVFVGIVLFFVIACEFFIQYKISMRKFHTATKEKEAVK
ncbi:MAG: ABC transporter permease [Clostridia bacterium]|nr:ABC transporter permease [Clostridia bacterium]